jgi:hypothetical protein
MVALSKVGDGSLTESEKTNGNEADALQALYDALKKGRKPTVRELSPDDRRAYDRVQRAKLRARRKESIASGTLQPTAGNIRDALADAAIMILAADGPGADEVRAVLGAVFDSRPGVPLTVTQRIRSGTLRPKLFAS